MGFRLISSEIDKNSKIGILEKWSDLSEKSFFVKCLKRTNTAENCLVPQNIPHPTDLSFSGIRKNFCLNLKKKSISVKK